MKNKAYFVKRLCELRGLDPQSEEAQALYSLKVVELLTEIKKSKSLPEPEPEPEPEPQQEEDEEEEFLTFAQRLGCT
jgi:hypothetical protein